MNADFLARLTKSQIVKVSDVTLIKIALAADAIDTKAVRKTLNIANVELAARGIEL